MSTNKTMAFLLALIVLIIGLSAVSASDVSNTHEVQADSSHVDIPTTVKSIETSDNNIKAQEPSTNVKQKTNENKHVLYRVTPIYEGDNLLASGVQMEALSVEDKGDGVCFNVYVYNVQPGIKINYATGESSLEQ